MRKAKKKVHPMPKLGMLDALLYWSAIVLCIIGFIAAMAVPRLAREGAAFSDPHVIATSPMGGESNWLWLAFWLMIMGFIIYSWYHERVHIFGRKDVKYGPPAYPRRYPLLMKNKPYHWVSAKEVALRKRAVTISATLMLLWLVIGLWLYPASMYERADLYSNGAIITYNSENQQDSIYRSSDVESVEIKIVSRKKIRSVTRRWYIDFVLNLNDGVQIVYRNTEFKGEWKETLLALVQLKSQFASKLVIHNSENLERLIRYYELDAEEVKLLNQLFDC